MNISPIFYMGNKKKLIKKGLIELFPKEINTFYDLFGGSGIISMNVNANSIVLNDIDNNLYNLYMMFKNYNSNDIINHIYSNIKKYNLPLERTKRNLYLDKDKITKYKKGYISLRNYFNLEKNILDFYTLMFYSFSQQFRFNKKGEFNMPFGNDYFSEKNSQYIIDSDKFFKSNKILFSNNDFEYFKYKINENDFVYLDPPYINTTATYNENGWNEDDENRVMKFCDYLNDNNIKFGLSNVIFSKNKINDTIIKWCENKKYHIFTFDSHKYITCGYNNNVKEVYICNYEVENV